MFVTINNTTSGICIWRCQMTDDAVEPSFKGGLRGTFCKEQCWDGPKAWAGSQQPSPSHFETYAKGAP